MLTVDVSALKVTKRRFEKMQERAKVPKTAMDLIGAKAFKDVINSFSLQQDEEGRPWKSLKRKRKRGGSRILQDTGRLRSSIRWAASKEEARVFTKVKYAKFHEYGTKNLPIRSFMWLSSKLRIKILADLLKYIKG